MKLPSPRFVIGLAVIVLGGLAYWLIDPLDSDLGGPTADAIAEEIGGECTTERSVVERANAIYPTLGAAASEIVRITCKEGYVNPGSILYRFDSPRVRREAFENGGLKLENERFCVLPKEAFNLLFSDSPQLCRELGGHLQGPKYPDPTLLPGGKS